MKVTKITMGSVQTNCYILNHNGDLIIIDPSAETADEFKRIEKAVSTQGRVIAVLLTHGHFDHIAGVDRCVSAYNVPVYIHTLDQPFLQDPNLNGSSRLAADVVVNAKAIEFVAGPLVIGDVVFEVVETPGHTHGSVTFISGTQAFVGDFIFHGSIGRTDLPTGSMQTMERSIHTFLEQYQDDLVLYPGHGELTRLSTERLINPYLQ
mgnify:CR=1 FL=1